MDGTPVEDGVVAVVQGRSNLYLLSVGKSFISFPGAILTHGTIELRSVGFKFVVL